MAAPTPVSAYLHSATMVKAGVFLLARFWPVLAGTDEWAWIIGGAGLCSLVLGASAATFQMDMKGVLAYSTIDQQDGVEGKSVSVRVDPGGSQSLKKKKKQNDAI